MTPAAVGPSPYRSAESDEVKYGESPRTTLDQIRSHDYGRRHFGEVRKVVALGLNFVPRIGTEPPAIEYATYVRYQLD